MSKEATKKFIENNGFICNKCGKIIVDGTKHKNEEDLCDQCKIADLEAKLAESEKKTKGFVELFDKKQHENYEQFCEIQQLKQQLAESENTACKNLAELTKIATEKDRKIEELKQQFAESKEQLNNSEQKCLICHKDQENEQLKQQLAEKDAERELDNSFWKQECDSLQKALEEKNTDLSLARNEIDTLKHNLNISQEHDNVMCEQYFEKCKQHNQDKISFAVEKLKEVKEFTDKSWWVDGVSECVVDYINDKIEELKKEMK